MKVTTQELEINPKLAYEMLKINTRNRNLSKEHVLFLADQMTKGLWKYNGESIIISSDNVLLDGQNRLAAIVKSNTTQKFIVVKGINSDSFDTIDVGKNRSAGDMLSILNVKSSSKIASIISSYSVLNANSTYFQSAVHAIKLSKQEIVKEYILNPVFWDNINDVSRKMYTKLRLLPHGIIGGYISFLIKVKNHDQEKVISFFTQLFFDKEIENVTIAVLRDKLLKSIIGQYKFTPKYRHALTVKAWNCYISGKELKVLNYNIDKELMPIFL